MSGLKIRARHLAVLAVLLLLICSTAAAAISYPFFTVTTDSVRMRRSASANATVLENLPSGTQIEVLGKTGSFYKVSYNNRTGYVRQEYISTDASVMITPTPAPVETVNAYPYDTVTGDSVNLRESKSVRSALLRQMPKGAAVTVHSVSGSWAEVEYRGVKGYAKSEYIILKKVVKVRVTPTPTPVPTLSPEESAGGYIILQQGSEGREVKALQEAMLELGFMSGAADGKFGAATHNAVILFQQTNSYPATGVMDANIQAFLYSGKPKNIRGTAVKINTLSPADGVTVKAGATGDLVADLQLRLTELGYYNGSITRAFDTSTRKAVIAFQKKNGLTADGIAGRATQDALFAPTALSAMAAEAPQITPAPTATPAPTFTVPSGKVQRDSTGEDAKLVQKRLKELGYYRSNVDGKFGALSVSALKKFQAANGLKDDGIAGNDTYRILFSSDALAKDATPTPAVTATPVPTAVPVITAVPAPTAIQGQLVTLRKGSSGSAVSLLQEALINLGYLTGTADGNYGDQTEAAVRAFQRVNGLTVDGTAGPQTQTKLYSMEAKEAPADSAVTVNTPKPAQATATPDPAKTGALRQGSTGSAVKDLQSRLISLGYLTGKADGIFGAKTFQAVIAFQRANRLSADGIAGSATQSALNSSSAVAAQTGTTVTPAPTKSPTATSVTPSASKVIYANWYTTIKAVARQYPYVTLYDFSSGISWQIHIFSLGAHADYEPLTANDTAKMERAFGGNTWNPKAVWAIFADGSIYLASTHSMPHEVQHITDNNFAGHSCLHFPRTQEQVTAIGPYATSHQACIDEGWQKTQNMK